MKFTAIEYTFLCKGCKEEVKFKTFASHKTALDIECNCGYWSILDPKLNKTFIVFSQV